MDAQDQTVKSQAGADLALPPELRPVAARYAALPTPQPQPADIVRLLFHLIQERPPEDDSSTRHPAPPAWRVARQRLGDLGRHRSRRWWAAWGLINMLGTDISYGVQISDEQLLREWQQGSEESLQTLLERRYGSLLAHCARLVGEAAAVEMVDDVFVHLVRETPTYQYPQSVSGLLYRSAGAAARQRERSVGQGSEAVGHGDLAAVLAPLTMAQREALSLCIGQGNAVQDAAALLDEPVEAVAPLVTTALVLVRDHLPPDETQGG